MKKKITLIVSAIALILCFSIASTMAWLVDKTSEVKNTFTYGDIDIDLVETVDGEIKSAADTIVENKTFKMIPGNSLSKDPMVIVKSNSEECWLFVEVKESENFDTFITYAINDGWKLCDSETSGSNIDTNTNDTYVIYREVSALASDQTFNILADNLVNVKEDVTKKMLNDLLSDSYPTLTFKAYAIQKANFVTAADAWAEIQK